MDKQIKGKKSEAHAQIEELLSILAQKGIITAADAEKVKQRKK